MNILSVIGRDLELFKSDISDHNTEISEIIRSSSFLVIGGAGSIGQSVCKEIFRRNPRKLHCIDINENNLVELVRDIRSSFGYIDGDFSTFALDVGSHEFLKLLDKNDDYDYVLNLSALKHVRSEKDLFTLSRMIDVNILNTEMTIQRAIEMNSKKYFCVSTDKAANPANMMGASKRIMEFFLSYYSDLIDISTARFANVAFSDGSLLASFLHRMQKKQPIAAPTDVRRYFLTPQESGELCMLSCLLGKSGEVFFPKLDEKLNLITFSEIAERFLKSQGFDPYLCQSEEEARSLMSELLPKKKWACYFSKSTTTGEKDYEEFYTKDEEINLEKFNGVGIVKLKHLVSKDILDSFKAEVQNIRNSKTAEKRDFVALFKKYVPNFVHEETGFNLNDKM